MHVCKCAIQNQMNLEMFFFVKMSNRLIIACLPGVLKMHKILLLFQMRYSIQSMPTCLSSLGITKAQLDSKSE